MMTFYKPLRVCVSFLPCLLAIISSTQAWQPYYDQPRYTNDLEEQRVTEMGELAAEMEQAQLATCAKMDFLNNDIVTKMEKLNCPQLQQADAAGATPQCTTPDQPGECVIRSEFRSVTNIILQRLEDLECKLDTIVEKIQNCCSDCDCKEDTKVTPLSCCYSTIPDELRRYYAGSKLAAVNAWLQQTPIKIGTYADPADSCKQIAEYCSDCVKSGYYYVRNDKSEKVKVYCDMDIDEKCGGEKGWMRIANVNMANRCHECPGVQLVEIKEGGKRLCTRRNRTNDHGCAHAPYKVQNVRYSKVCGKVIGYQREQPDAFMHYWEKKTTSNIHLPIDADMDSYVDGVSITRKNSAHTHIWTFAAAQDEQNIDLKHHARQCSCSVSLSEEKKVGIPNTESVPAFVGENYFCDSGTRDSNQGPKTYLDDPLWDGAGCGGNSSCCTFRNPPYFQNHNLTATTDDIDVRLCAWFRMGKELIGKDIDRNNEDTPLEEIELYIQ